MFRSIYLFSQGPNSSGVKRRHALHNHSNAFDENLVVIYNRVPKTGSTSFINLAYDLCKKNHFFVLHINITANMHVLSLSNQVKFILRLNHWMLAFDEVHSWLVFLMFQVQFVRNITEWRDIKPALYHGHMAYLDFSKWVSPFGHEKHPKWLHWKMYSIFFFRFSMPQKPLYINLIRKPLDRLVSYYYFLRNGDNYRPNLIRRKAGDKMVN